MVGIPCPTAIGEYHYSKRRKNNTTRDVAVAVFPLAFTEQLDEWPEQDERETRWFGLAEAARSIAEPDLAALIAGFRAPPTPPGLAARIPSVVQAKARQRLPLLSWFHALLPKQGRFFELFEAHSATLVGGAEALALLLRGGEGMDAQIREIVRREHEADDLTRDVLQDVRRIFVTPFDRSAITGLIGVMDDTIDQMNSTASTIALYGVTEFPQPMRDISGIIVEAARVTAEGHSAAPLARDQRIAAARADRAAGAAGRPCRRDLRCRAEDRVQRSRRQRDGVPRQARALRQSGARRRPVRGYRQRDPGSRDRSRLSGAPMLSLHLLIALIAVALLFDFLNGLHDAANSIATVVSTRVLKPQYAVLWAAFFNFIAFLVFGLHVATTIGTGLIAPGAITSAVIFAALVGAIFWNVVTWLFGIPSSSSHALVGGLLGAGIAKAGFSAVVWGGVGKTVAAILLSPALGLGLALLLVLIVAWACVRSTPVAVDRRFRKIQLVSAALYSLGHGGNDAQKTMGIIAVLLYANGQLGGTFHIPLWVVLSCQSAMAIGTLAGGWRIVHTMGSKITRLTPAQGFCAETGGAITLFAATYFGIPVSTTHTITGAIVGVGASRRLSAVRWNVASSIVVAWVVTLPASGLVAALAYEATRLFG